MLWFKLYLKDTRYKLTRKHLSLLLEEYNKHQVMYSSKANDTEHLLQVCTFILSSWKVLPILPLCKPSLAKKLQTSALYLRAEPSKRVACDIVSRFK